VQFEIAYKADLARNFSGGITQGNVYLANLDVQLTLNTQQANWWKGGTFHFYGLNNHGQSLSALVGDLQVVNNIEALSFTRFYEFWYRHEFEKLTFTLGQYDLNADFFVSDFGLLFLHSSFGIQPDVSVNVPVSIFPVATLAFWGQWEISPNWSLLGGVFKGQPGTEEENPNSLLFKFQQDEGTFLVSELHYKPQNEGSALGTYKLGFWKHTAADLNLNGQQPRGVYLIGDYPFPFPQEQQSTKWGTFFQLGAVQKAAAAIKSYWGFGIVGQHIWGSNIEDALGLAYASARLTEGYQNRLVLENTNEAVVELTYSRSLGSHFSVQPNLQYVLNPSAVSKSSNAWVGMFRFVFQL